MKKVLIVEDSKVDVQHLTSILSRNGYSVIEASDGLEGVEIASQENPDVVLMDIVMPGINGFQATRQLNKNPDTNDIPVVMISTKSQDSDKEWSKVQGAKGFLVKPIAEKQLLETINALV